METPFPPRNIPDTEQSGRQTVRPLAHTLIQHPPVEPPLPPGLGVRADLLKCQHHPCVCVHVEKQTTTSGAC